MSKTISVGIGDMNVASPPDILATYALGSCVGICLLDKQLKVGGLAHIMLPWSTEAANSKDNPLRYADTCLAAMLMAMQKKGVMVSRLTAKIAGGAQMFAASGTFNIGERNVDAVKKVLQHYRIPIIAQDTGKNYGRTVFFDASTGTMEIKSASQGITML